MPKPKPAPPIPPIPTPQSTLRDVAPGIARPRYRPQVPLLWRGPGQLQVGEGTFHVLLRAVSSPMVSWLVGLDGLRTMDQVDAELPIPAVDAARMLRAGMQAVAIEDASCMPDAWRWASVAERDSASGDRQAAASTYGSMARADLALDRRARARWWVRGHGCLADQVRVALGASGLPEASSAQLADVQVLADTRHPVALGEPEPAGPHLPVGAYGDRAMAGPLVIPGRSSCLQCAWLHTRDADPDWAVLSLQLERSIDRLASRPVDRLHGLMAGTAAAALLRCWVDAPEGTSWLNRAIEIRLPDGHRIEHERPRHPMCSCTWDR